MGKNTPQNPTTGTEKLSITLPREMVRKIRAKVASGQYASNSEVIRAAMRSLDEHSYEDLRIRSPEHLDLLLQEGIESADRGELYTLEETRQIALEGLEDLQ